MERETSNKIRTIVEDFIPPVLKDSILFRYVARLAFGSYVERAADFRARAPFLTEGEYVDFYRNSPHVHADTDNSQACIDRIISEIEGQSVVDVGCGTGYLLRAIQNKHPRITRLAGVEIVPPAPTDRLEFFEGKAERLPFRDNEFDTVICTHVIEHILDRRAAIAELRRVANKRLIIVVPKERESLYSFNPHFHFFPYPHSFLRSMIPVPINYVCESIGRDIYYQETKSELR